MNIPSPLQKVDWSVAANAGISCFVKRDDLIHPLVSGNKWRKLKNNVEVALQKKLSGILTFGGAYSNHLLATAAACAMHGIESIGVVRGEELSATSNPTLSQCHELGMKLVFVTREQYSDRDDEFWIKSLREEYGPYHIVPEGGANYYGVNGVSELMMEDDLELNHVLVACGTGTTAAGLMMTAPSNCTIHAVSVLKGVDQRSSVEKLVFQSVADRETTLEITSRHQVHDGYHAGGYAKFTEAQLGLMRSFYAETGIKTDPIYTGKMLLATEALIKSGTLKSGESICLIHTGGLQGIEGFENRHKLQMYP